MSGRAGTAGTVALALLVLVGIPGIAWWVVTRPREPAAAGTAAIRYQCPMHPTMTSDRPGDCPICGMRLVPIEPHEHPASPPPADPGAATAPPGATVVVPPDRRNVLGVKTTTIERSPFVKEIRAVGRVTRDESRLRAVSTKVSGFVEKLLADTAGKVVHEGDPLLEIYSPELLASQQEYLVALRSRERARTSTVPSVARSGDELVESARRRLELYDLTDEQIHDLEATGVPRRRITIYAPGSGTIAERSVTVGQKVEPGMTLLTLVDLSRVWIVGSVYEYDLPFVRVGQAAKIVLPYAPGGEIRGTVSFVYPDLDEATRTARVRVELPNPSGSLRPDMYADVLLEADLGMRLAVPASAVVETGTRSVVFVERGEGRFEPREISIGLRLPDAYEVRSGLAEGDRVVASATFFVDSESRIRSAAAGEDH